MRCLRVIFIIIVRHICPTSINLSTVHLKKFEFVQGSPGEILEFVPKKRLTGKTFLICPRFPGGDFRICPEDKFCLGEILARVPLGTLDNYKGTLDNSIYLETNQT